MTDLKLRKINSITYAVENTRLEIRKMAKQFSGETKDYWELWDLDATDPIEENIITFGRAKYEARKYINDALLAYHHALVGVQ